MSTISDEKTQNFLDPLKQFFSDLTNQSNSKTGSNLSKNDYDEPINEAKLILNRAAETKNEDPELVLSALEDLEKLMRFVFHRLLHIFEPCLLICVLI